MQYIYFKYKLGRFIFLLHNLRHTVGIEVQQQKKKE